MPSPFDRTVDAAFGAMKPAKDLRKVPDVLRNIAMVHAGQGIIDNGGLQYFFEQDFPGNPPYALFVEAYRAIGAVNVAVALERAVALFPFEDPHKHRKKRDHFLDSFNDDEGNERKSPFEPFTRQICGNKDVWPLLKQYVKSNAKQLRELQRNS